jgi:DNA-binding CsgD family transcriptional regulator
LPLRAAPGAACLEKQMPKNKSHDHVPARGAADAVQALERGRAHFERHEWDDAFAALIVADQATPLGPEDLDRLAWSAGLTARDEELVATLERLYHYYHDARDHQRAARAAFWLGFRLLARGETARAGGWLGRADRLVAQHGEDCVEQGYLLLPAGQRQLHAGNAAEAHDAAARAAQIGERFGDIDLVAIARNLQGRALLSEGKVAQGLPLMDEAMVAATSGELTPVVTGIIYCTAISSCQRVYALDRAREWTSALASWCDAHPQLVAFTANCLVHRAEILQISGAWPEAVEEARRAAERCVRDVEREARGHAHYELAEVHRLRGEYAQAESAYRDASREGVEPQPGLALLRLAQGDRDAAAGAIRRVVDATSGPFPRTRFLPAHVEIMLVVGDLDAARAASRELDETAAAFDVDVLAAIAAHARGAVQLAEGDARAVLDPARRAFAIWQRIGAPYLAARLRVLVARACIALADGEGARLELEGAREVYERLGALPDLATVDALFAKLAAESGEGKPSPNHGLTGRELQVLRLVASGRTNKAIARELALSEKTIDRHLSNIFAKLEVPTRAAATAFAYEHGLV